MRPSDVLRVGAAGLRRHTTRVLLSALGLTLGIGAMIAVVGVSTSSSAALERQLAALGTNMLTVGAGQTLAGAEAHLPESAVAAIDRIGPVLAVTATGQLSGVKVYRNDLIPAAQSGGISVQATRIDLPDTAGVTMRSGAFLNEATAHYPAVVLGSVAARRLGVGDAAPQQQVWLGFEWFIVVGVMHPIPLAPELDQAALIGWPVARELLRFDGHPTTVYTRVREESVEAVRSVLARTANPEHPNEVTVSRPSEALAAKRATNSVLGALLFGLGGVALLVGGVGVANTMVISVLERRAEIGLRRALGATRGHIRLQFLTEALLLSALGGAAGTLLGIVLTATYATVQHWPTVVPGWASAGGVAATLLIGALAGLYPALRAARLAPTVALAAAA